MCKHWLFKSSRAIPFANNQVLDFKQISAGSFHVLFIHSGGLVLGYLIHFFLVKWMGQHEYGLLAYVNSICALAGVLVSFGLPVAALRFVSEFYAQKKYAELKGFIRLGGWGILISSIIGAFCVIWAKENLGFFPGIDLNVIVVGLLLGLPISSLNGWQYELFRSRKEVLTVSWVQNVVAPSILMSLSAIIFYFQSRLLSVDVLILMSGIGLITWFLLSFRTINCWINDFSSIKSKYRIKDWSKVSLPLLLTSFSMVLMAQIDIFLVGYFLGPESAGIYGIAIKMAGLAAIVLTAVNVLAAPVYSDLFHSGNHEEMRTFAKKVSHLIFWPSLGIALLLLGAADSVLGFFGDDFRQAKFVVLFLVLGQLINAGSGSVGFIADLTGLQKGAAIIRMICAFLNVLLSFIFIKIWGMSGAALATAICLSLWNILLYRLVSRVHNINPSILNIFSNE